MTSMHRVGLAAVLTARKLVEEAAQMAMKQIAPAAA